MTFPSAGRRSTAMIAATAGLAMMLAGCDFFGGLLPGGSPSPSEELFQAYQAGTLTDVAPQVANALGDSTALDSLGVAADSLPGDQPLPDSTAGAPTDTAAVVDVPTPATIPVVGTDGETVAAPQTPEDLQARIARLEAVNDSLRATVLGLVALQARLPAGSDGAAAQDSATGTNPQAIIGAGASRARNWGLRIFFSIVFLALAGTFIQFVGWILDQLAERSAQRRLFYKRLAPISRILLWVLAGTFTALVILGIDASGLVAAGAAGGVALGFASQDILKNVFGGLIVLFDQPFQVGDKISVAGSYGEVVAIGLRSTRIVTPDDNLVTVPNAQVVDGQVANANAGELNCQVVTDLWLPGWVDEARAKDIAFEAATSSKYVYHNKPIVVLVKDEFDRVPLTHLKVKAYVLDPRYEFLFASDVTERARASFRDAGLLPRERGFDPGAVDFYDPFSQARWGGRLTPHPPQGNGAPGEERGPSATTDDAGPLVEEDS